MTTLSCTPFRALSTMTALLLSVAAFAQNPAVTVTVDANLNKRAIDPRVYGVAYATTAQLVELNCLVNRYGGNNTSRYNWQLNADNRANDWFYESIPDDSATAGERGDTFIRNTRNAGIGAEPMITIPMVGYVAKLGANRAKLGSFLVSKYGAQQNTDPWFPDAGNGVKTNGSLVTGNNPLDANVVADAAFQQAWAQHLVSVFGTAANGGLKYYIYDNEPSIWHGTHRDVHPTGANMEEIRDKIIAYGTKIRAVDPGAILVGPEEWGWSGYFYSGYDQQWGNKNGWGSLPDRNNHGGMDYLPWLLDQLRQNNTSTGKRLLDIFTVHYYPQGGEFSEDTSTAMQLRRNRSTRSLWDPNYVDETWVNDRVKLIPRLRDWVNQYYPGTKTGITEYNWGAEGHINGATTQADIYGIFGREGLDIAARWTTPTTTSPVYKAMKMYRNYDGNKSTFGDTSVSAAAPSPDNLSAFAATRNSDGALTIMVINKVLTGNTPVSLSLKNFSAGSKAQVWQLTSANAITRLTDANVTSSTITATVPPQSITLFVVPQTASVPVIQFNGVAFAQPAKINRKTTTRITVNIKNLGGPSTNTIVDMEVYNAAGQKVFQKTATNQSFSGLVTKSYWWNWTPATAGTYTVKVGVFSGDWSTTYYWNNGAATITVL